MGTFSAQISRFRQQTQQEADRTLRRVGLEAYTRVQRRTPVDSGDLRKSWTVAINQLPADFDGSRAQLSRVKFGDTLYIATDKVYAPMLEYGLYPQPSPTGKTRNGFSIQAPQGMVRITMSELQPLIQRLARG